MIVLLATRSPTRAVKNYSANKGKVTLMDVCTLQMAEWLEKRIREAESKDHTLIALKQEVREATEIVKAAQGDAIASALKAQAQAIWALIDHQSVRNG